MNLFFLYQHKVLQELHMISHFFSLLIQIKRKWEIVIPENLCLKMNDMIPRLLKRNEILAVESCSIIHFRVTLTPSHNLHDRQFFLYVGDR